MGYVITNGSKFIRIDDRNRFDTTRDISSIKVFDTLVKAKNFAACLPRAYREAGYEVVKEEAVFETLSHESEDQETEPALEVPDKPKLDERFLDLEYIGEHIREFEEFTNQFHKQKKLISQEQLRAEREIIDIEHAAELCDLDVRRGYILYKMLHDARKRRRACKDALLILEHLEERLDPKVFEGQNTKTVDGLFCRTFTPREIKNLFEIFQGKVTSDGQ